MTVRRIFSRNDSCYNEEKKEKRKMISARRENKNTFTYTVKTSGAYSPVY
jgi:hypothetical protein